MKEERNNGTESTANARPPRTFWGRQVFRLWFGLICVGPFWVIFSGNKGGWGPHPTLSSLTVSSLIFILLVLPLLNCRPFFRLWDKYTYFRRACYLMLAERLLEISFPLIASSEIGVLSKFSMFIAWSAIVVGTPIEEAAHYVIGDIMDSFTLGSPTTPTSSQIIFTGFGTYIVLWILIGVVFFLQVFFHFLHYGKWEYK